MRRRWIRKGFRGVLPRGERVQELPPVEHQVLLGGLQPVRGDQGLEPDTLSLSLEEAVARALRESEEIAAARAVLAQAEAQVTQATSGALPQLSSSLIYNRAIKSIFD
ncbi:MAG: hypothetical protein E4G90_06505, partial [Gemmatimonadales bacterium]